MPGWFFLNYLTDFNYFQVKKNPGHDQIKAGRKITFYIFWKVIVFAIYHWFSVILFSNRQNASFIFVGNCGGKKSFNPHATCIYIEIKKIIMLFKSFSCCRNAHFRGKYLLIYNGQAKLLVGTWYLDIEHFQRTNSIFRIHKYLNCLYKLVSHDHHMTVQFPKTREDLLFYFSTMIANM